MITRVEEILIEAKKYERRYRLVLAGSENVSAVETVITAKQRGLIEPVLVGEPERSARAAGEANYELNGVELVGAGDSADVVAKSLQLIKDGRADILMKGQVSTRALLKGLLSRQYGFRTGRLLSHVGIFNVPGEDRILIITDAGVNVTPDVPKKKDILLNAVDVAHLLGNPCPRVAMLSFVEDATDQQVRLTADANRLAEMYRTGEITGCVVEGPYSLDVALSPEAARIKGVSGDVAGRADILVMHDIGMGNVLYKALLLWCKPVIAGVVMGSKIPVTVSSRADTMQTKLNSIALAVMLAHEGVRYSE